MVKTHHLVVGVLICLVARSAQGQPCLVEQQQKVVGIDTLSNDWFGTSVSIGRDFAVVGAPNEGHTAPYNGSGAAYVLRRDRNGTPLDSSGDQWIHQAKLVASDSIVSGRFGTRVAMTDELIFVSAVRDSRGIVGSGAVYVFQHDDHDTPADPSDDSWLEVAKLYPLDAPVRDVFGSTGMAVHRDTAIVGAIGAGNSGGTQQDGTGAAYVFRRNDNGTPNVSNDDFWFQEARLVASNAARRDQFGKSVSISGQWAVVGAPLRGHSWDGAAYVFRRDQGGTPSEPSDDVWTEHIALPIPPDTRRFGQSVAISGNRLIVGAPGEGAAYVYRRDANNTPEDDSDDLWIQEARLFDDAVSSFGGHVAIHANVVAIGAELFGGFCDPNSCGSGKVFFYRRNGIDWSLQDAVVSGRNPAFIQDGFARSISLNCDTAAVGAGFDHDGGFYAGAAFFYAQNCGDCDEDCNANGIPDLNEFDSDGDGIIDECDGCPLDPAKLSPGLCGCGIAESDDSDGDDFPNGCDACLDSDLAKLIVLEECPTGVPNQLLNDGCTMNDVLTECSVGAHSHGESTACVARHTNEWRRRGLLSGKDVGRIARCAGSSNERRPSKRVIEGRTPGRQ